jgi:hypothetical protein
LTNSKFIFENILGYETGFQMGLGDEKKTEVDNLVQVYRTLKKFPFIETKKSNKNLIHKIQTSLSVSAMDTTQLGVCNYFMHSLPVFFFSL